VKLDRLIAKHRSLGRSEAHRMISSGCVRVNDAICTANQHEIDRFMRVDLHDESVQQAERALYLMMHKPGGVVSATIDAEHRTVIDLIDDPDKHRLHIAGRLDRWSTGLLLLTNDGRWSKQFMDADSKVPKTYIVETDVPIPGDAIAVLVVDPEALTLLANQAFHDINFFLRPKHLKQVAAILDDPEASENDRMVALTMLKNADVASAGLLPFCQDTGTAIIMGKKGQQVWTGGGDEAALSKGVYDAYTENNLRYSQNAAADMFNEKNTGTNLPAQLDLYATDGDAYKFLFIAKGGGSANKAFLYQETRAVLNPKSIVKFPDRQDGDARHRRVPALPPHLRHRRHLGRIDDEDVKLASTKYYDNLPTTGNEHGRAFRDVELEAQMLQAARECGIGAQFGGKYFALDVRIIRLPRHGASLPIGIGVSCSADRQAKGKITRDGVFIEKLETNRCNTSPRSCATARTPTPCAST
jgi:tartrate dehydratase alpha subunit/fumarate hydratase class I-like protein